MLRVHCSLARTVSIISLCWRRSSLQRERAGELVRELVREERLLDTSEPRCLKKAAAWGGNTILDLEEIQFPLEVD